MLAESHLDKKNIRQAFAKAAHSYDAMAALQRQVGHDLLSEVSAKDLTGTILDVGCGTGFLTGELLALSGYQQIIALDLAFPMVEATRAKYRMEKLTYLCADAENLPLQANSVDTLFSNVALQWCQNLSAVFEEMKRVLKPTGSLIFSTFGSQTLHELKTAWANVDRFSHVNEFYNTAQIYDALKYAGYKNIIITEKIHRPYYASVIALMRELKGIGAHNVMAGRNHNMTGKSKMQAMIHHYESLHSSHKIPATFEIIKVSAKI
ncbi:MAG: malonyl-ACP O-methyltransferase BioC [Methylococcales bacterium]|nr:malonyl-ACP O-methyltransferase BioC [Methylococcales bacterium]